LACAMYDAVRDAASRKGEVRAPEDARLVLSGGRRDRQAGQDARSPPRECMASCTLSGVLRRAIAMLGGPLRCLSSCGPDQNVLASMPYGPVVRAGGRGPAASVAAAPACVIALARGPGWRRRRAALSTARARGARSRGGGIGRGRARHFRENFAQGGVELAQIIPELITDANTAIGALGGSGARSTCTTTPPTGSCVARWRRDLASLGVPALFDWAYAVRCAERRRSTGRAGW